MSNKLKLAIAAVALALTGCASAPQLSPKPDAADAGARYFDLVSHYNVPVTGRDWNCKGCYK